LIIPPPRAATAAKSAAEGKDTVVCVVRRSDGDTIEVELKPGAVGLQLVPITKGAPPSPLPADTGDALDASLADGRDEWSIFELNGTQRGFEHITLRTEGDVIHLVHEVAFDGAPDFGLHHAIVKLSIRCGVTAEPQTLWYENGLNGWLSEGRLIRDDAGGPVWRAESGMPDAKETTEIALRTDIAPVPTYAVAQLARLLPQRKGVCFRFRPINDWDGSASLRAAIICEGSEELEIGGKKVVATKFVQKQLGGTTLGTYWFDAERNLVQADYGGPVAKRSTRAKALAGLNEGLKPRTAD